MIEIGHWHVMGDEAVEAQGAVDEKLERIAHTLDVDRMVALVRVDHVKSPPIP